MKTTTLLLIAFASVYTTSSFSQPGTLDTTFNKNGIILKPGLDARAVAIQTNGKIIVGGNTSHGFTLERFTTTGQIDNNFGKNNKAVAFPNQYLDSNGRYYSYAYSVVIEPDGKIIAAGNALNNNLNNNFAIAKFNTDGTLDNSFGNKGRVTTDFFHGSDEAHCVLLQPDNKLVVAGIAQYSSGFPWQRFALARYNADGSLDKSFNNDGKIAKELSDYHLNYSYSAIIQDDGKIVEIGSSYIFAGQPPAIANNFALMRIRTNGSIDSSFGRNGYTFTSFGSNYFATATSSATQSDGKIIVAGVEYDNTPIYKVVVTRYTRNGRLDSSFGTNGSVITNFDAGSAFANGVVIQPDDKILIAGYTENPDASLVARFTKNGKVDSSFSNGGYSVVTNGGNYYAITLQTDGKIVTVGKGTIARFLNDIPKENLIANNALDVSTNKLTPSIIQIFPNPVKDVLHITGINSAQSTIPLCRNVSLH